VGRLVGPGEPPHSSRCAMEIRDDDPPGAALRRLIGWTEQMPSPGRSEVRCHLSAAKERFVLLRRLGVESVCLVHQGRPVDPSLSLEVGALATNHLTALAEALPDRSFTRESFFNLMHSQVESHREMDATWSTRSLGIQCLVAAQNKLGLLERAVTLAAGEEAIVAVRREAADCAVYIGFFAEALRRRVPEC
jgi:hypothetical protein